MAVLDRFYHTVGGNLKFCGGQWAQDALQLTHFQTKNSLQHNQNFNNIILESKFLWWKNFMEFSDDLEQLVLYTCIYYALQFGRYGFFRELSHFFTFHRNAWDALRFFGCFKSTFYGFVWHIYVTQGVKRHTFFATPHSKDICGLMGACSSRWHQLQSFPTWLSLSEMIFLGLREASWCVCRVTCKPKVWLGNLRGVLAQTPCDLHSTGQTQSAFCGVTHIWCLKHFWVYVFAPPRLVNL